MIPHRWGSAKECISNHENVPDENFRPGRRKGPKAAGGKKSLRSPGRQRPPGFRHTTSGAKDTASIPSWTSPSGSLSAWAGFALQVKGGHYFGSIDGDWHLENACRYRRQSGASPLDEAWLAALDLHDDIEERACTRSITPTSFPWCLIFPDMEPDPKPSSIWRAARECTCFGASGALMDDLD